VDPFMKTVLKLLAVAFCACIVLPSSFADQVSDERFTTQVSDILRECIKIKPGMTRAELLKVFTVEGGVSTAKYRTYIQRHCRYIKVDVTFTLSSPKQDVLKEEPTDKIATISRPYLEFSIID
jgi:hypothetical protein